MRAERAWAQARWWWTGSASGIGQETALAFPRSGARIVALELDMARLAETVRLVEGAGRRCLAVGCDVSDERAVEAAAGTVLRGAGVPDIRVNNAGVGFVGPLVDTPASAWRHVFGVDVMGIVHVTRAFLPAMPRARGPRHLVNVASAAGLHPVPHPSAYSASKHAAPRLSDTLARWSRTQRRWASRWSVPASSTRRSCAIAAPSPRACSRRLWTGSGASARRAASTPPWSPGASCARRGAARIVLVEKSAVRPFHARRLSRRWLRRASIAGARKLGYYW